MGCVEGKVALISGRRHYAAGAMIVAEGGSVMLADVQIDKAKAVAEKLGPQAAAISLTCAT